MAPYPGRFGTECRLTYDAPDTDIEPGDVVVTSGGSAYIVLEPRLMRSKYVGRWMLRCVRIDPASIDPSATMHTLYWYPRVRRRP